MKKSSTRSQSRLLMLVFVMLLFTSFHLLSFSSAGEGGDQSGVFWYSTSSNNDDDIKSSSSLLRSMKSLPNLGLTSLPHEIIPMSISPLSESYSELNHDKVLPSFVDQKGGVVIFYHVSKTGGQSIRYMMEKAPGKDFYRCVFREYINRKLGKKIPPHQKSCPYLLDGSNQVRMLEKKVLPRLDKNTDLDPYLVELHGGPAGTGLIELAPYLRKWRAIAKRNNKPFFVFTLVREPVSFAVSYFKFFNTECKFDWCETQYEATEENLLRAAVSNHQCFLLAHTSATEGMDERAYEHCPVTKDDCEDIYTIMKEQLDWVGTTEKASKETLPLLSYIVNGNWRWGERMHAVNVADESDFESQLHHTTVSKLRQLSPWDVQIHNRVLQDYTLDMWKNLPDEMTRSKAVKKTK